jgi:hypothetical protein
MVATPTLPTVRDPFPLCTVLHSVLLHYIPVVFSIWIRLHVSTSVPTKGTAMTRNELRGSEHSKSH